MRSPAALPISIFLSAAIATGFLVSSARCQIAEDRGHVPVAVFIAMSQFAYLPPDKVLTAKERADYYATLAEQDACQKAESYFTNYCTGFEVLQPKDVPGVGLEDFMGTTEPHATLFRRVDAHGRTYVLAFRGTKTVADWLIDLGGGLGIVPSYYEKSNALVANLVKRLSEEPNASLVLTGHSLGGGIAEYTAARNGLVAVTFNSAHLSQPFPVQSNAAIYTYHVAGEHLWNRTLSGDIVNGLRLGGNFEQTAVTSVRVGKGFVFYPHYMARFFDWQPAPIPLRPLRTSFDPKRPLPRSTLLQSMPTLVADVPPMVREAVRRKDVDACPLFVPPSEDRRVDIWDLRFRVSRLYDSYPSGGLPDEAMRVLVPPSGASVPADYATAFDLQTAFSFPFTPATAFTLWTDHRSLNYHQEKSQDFSFTTVGGGLTVSNHATRFTWSTGGKIQRFKSTAGNMGQLGTLEMAGSWQSRRDDWLFWENISVGALRKAGVSGGNGTVIDGNAGLRHRFWRSVTLTEETGLPQHQAVVQLRAFDGIRTSNEALFANQQWGVGLGLTYQRKDFHAFVEPALRWTRHHLATTRKLSDHELVTRAELAWAIRASVHEHRILGWEIALGYTHVSSDTVDGNGDYERDLIGAQLSKRF